MSWVNVQAPLTEAELLQRAKRLAGLTLRDLACQLNLEIPLDLRYAKGWFGQALEAALGATAGSKSEPDFQALSVELKTIPINKSAKPQESTYVCVVPMRSTYGLTWHTSCVYQKLKRVLWIPFEADATIDIPLRRIGSPILWSPSVSQEQALQQDWEELMEIVCLGQVESISAHQGVYLQIRPKAQDSHAKRKGVGVDGETIMTLPRGFYLRARFTEQVLRDNCLLIAF